MSWGIEITGTKAGVAKYVAEELDKIAASYAGKPEADDVAACKGRILALVEASDLTETGTYAPNAVQVKANGSHGTTTKGISNASFQVSVVRWRLALDPA
ncbi:MAG TPA: hypothetical protein VMI75_31120 [Polyangiaceae bacterium]|nr:hypothetical protein [Polyangiaceae bacterium]